MEMKHRRLRQVVPTGVLLAVALAVPSPVPAHHSFAAYESTQTRTIKGTVETFQWVNPHVAFKMRVEPDGGGEPQEWSIETSGPAILTRFGWTRSSIKPGDRISVICNPLSDGSHGGRLHTVVVLDTGQTLKTKLSDSAKPGLK